VKDVLDDYQRLHLEAHRRPATLANWFVPGRKHLAQFEGRRVDRLEPSELARWHTTLGATKATAANRALEVLRSAISWSMERNGLRLAANPAAGIQPHAETERERFVLRSEVGRFFAALELTPQPWRDLLLLSLLTGQRRGAVQALRWDHLDLGGGIWYLPAFSSKNSKAAAVPLVRPVVELLERRPRIGGSPFVFPARSKSGHVGSPKKEWARLLERSGLQDLRPHDLRRTIGSWMAAANTSLHVIGSALGHASKESTAIYARLQHEPVRAALTSAANEIIAAARPKRRRA
jgi:integrase